MSAVPIRPPLVAVASALPDQDTETNELTDPVICGRCRLSFVQHPSVVPGDFTRWWLCPPCRDWFLGQRSKRNPPRVEIGRKTKKWTTWTAEYDSFLSR